MHRRTYPLVRCNCLLSCWFSHFLRDCTVRLCFPANAAEAAYFRMILTLKTLQQQSFKIEIDSKETVGHLGECVLPRLPAIALSSVPSRCTVPTMTENVASYFGRVIIVPWLRSFPDLLLPQVISRRDRRT